MSGPCAVNGCEREQKAKGYCPMHYRRWQKAGDPGPAESLRGGKSCSVNDCDREFLARGYCAVHYGRWKANGDPGEAELRRVPNQGGCRVEDCPSRARSNFLCEKHLGRYYTHGEEGLTRISQRDPGHSLTYYGAHFRTRTERGHATEYQCIKCDDQAAEWSYQHDDPNELTDDRGIQYSADPHHYEPLCIPCHRRFDLDWINESKKEKAA